jgi:AAA+ ATPase superfamily predicted ATPase
MRFVNRIRELEALEAWWGVGGARLGLVWGRRRVGKTLLLQQFADGRARTVFHTFAGRSARDELDVLAESWRVAGQAAERGEAQEWHLPIDNWTRFLAALGREARDQPILLILDEFQEGVAASPELPGIIRALWDDPRARGRLRVLLCGSAVRTMDAMQEERAALYGRFDLSLLVHPFDPHEAALMLPDIHPLHRAVAWGILGGTPHYLDLWDQTADPPENIRRLFFSRGGRLLLEGELALRGETLADLEVQVLHAIALGHTRHNQIADTIHAEPSRQIERLIELRLVVRVQPVTEEGTRSRRRIYRLADNFMAFWLGQVLPHRAAIDRGLGDAAWDAAMSRLSGFLGPRFEEAFRIHLRHLAARGDLGERIVAVGAFWSHEPPAAAGAERVDTEIDAVALAGPRREAVLAGEAKLHHTVEAEPILRALERKVERLPRRAPTVRLAIAAGLAVVGAPPEVLTVTATDIFGLDGEPVRSLHGQWVP